MSTPHKHYHAEKTGRTFQIFVITNGGHNQHQQQREIAIGVLNDPSVFEEVCRMVAHANLSLALAATCEAVADIENAVKQSPSML